MKRISLVSIFLGIKKSQLKFFFKKYSYTGYFVFRPPPPHPHHAQHASSPSAHPTSDVNFYDPLATPFQVTIGFIFCQLFSFHFPQFFYLFNFSFFLLKLLKIFYTDKEIHFPNEWFSDSMCGLALRRKILLPFYKNWLAGNISTAVSEIADF